MPSGDLAELLGGRRAAIDASLPPLAFALGWLLSGKSLLIGTVVAVIAALVIAGWRLRRGEQPRAVLVGALGVAVGALIALRTGHVADVFLLQIVTNAASALAWAVSIVLRWPLLGVIAGLALGQKTSWRRDPALLRAYSRASWVWVGQYAVRLAVFLPLYASNAVVALAGARIALTWPLVAACLGMSWWVLRRSLPPGHPGIRHPRIPGDVIGSPFTPEVVAQIAHHMNTDHAADNVVIVRALGGHPAATTAVMINLDAEAIEFLVDDASTARVPFGTTLTERAQVRSEVTRMFHEAQAALAQRPAFSARLRDATADLHDEATKAPYLADLMHGRIDAAGYAHMVAQHWYAYRDIEEIAATYVGDPIVAAFHSDALNRLPAIEADLEALLGEQWQDLITPSDATKRYTARIRECAGWPGGYVAHHYTRYVGDLSGGQAIRRVVDRTIGLGTSFYDFTGLGDLKAFKKGYRQHLDTAPWDEAEQARVIAEARRAYELNIEVLRSLGAAPATTS